MRKAIRSTLVALAAVLAACSEGNVVAPRSEAPSGPPAVGGGSTQSLSGVDTLRFSFVIDPSRNLWYYLGAGNSITFPAHSLCDPSRSTYGMGQWDKSCTPATSPLTVTAKAWIDASGHPRIDFNPQIRFVPTDNPAGWVSLTFTDYSGAQSWLSILYCQNEHTSHCVDESKIDPTLATFRDPATGRLTRRIKHFSGYNVGAGDDSSSTGGGDASGMDRMPMSGPSFNSSSNSKQNINAVLRQSEVGTGHSASAVIGPWGGVLNMKSTGFTLIVPPGAVRTNTTFKVTAVPGKLIAYDFEPHGIRFNVPVLFVQDLRGANLKSLFNTSVHGAYFMDDSQLDESGGGALVDEVLNAAIDPFTGNAIFPIWHFSGYMLAMG